MKKQLLIFSIFVLLISVFVSCNNKAMVEDIPTSIIANENGETEYYIIVSDENGTLFYEVERDDAGEAVTDKNGRYITKKHTIVNIDNSEYSAKNDAEVTTSSNTNSNNHSKQASSEVSANSPSSNNNDDDNDVEFEETTTSISNNNSTLPTQPPSPSSSTTEESTPGFEPETDKDGWITKWY